MKISKYLIGAAAVCLAASMTACGSKGTSKDSEQTQKEVSAEKEEVEYVQTLADDEALRPDQSLDKITILDFNATWCMPCKKFAPAFDKVAEQKYGEINFVSVDIDECPKTAQAFGVQAVPTVIILDKDGKVLKTFVGTEEILPAEKFEAVVNSL